MSVKTKSSLIQRLHQAKEGKREAISTVIATLLLIAIAVAAGIVLYVFVSGLTTSLSNVRGTVLTPLQIIITSVTTPSGGGWTIAFQVTNPNGATVTLNAGTITDDSGVQVASCTLTGTTSVSSHTNAPVTCSVSSGLLTHGETYRLTVSGADPVGDQVTSNPAPFTAS